MALTMPCPPEVPGSHAARTESELERMSSMRRGLPERRTLTRGMFLSCSLRVV
jgi:hypothetical protein